MNKSAALSDRDRQVLLKFLLGGTAIGGATALGTSLFGHLNNLNRDAAELKNKTPDDTLVLNMDPQKKIAAVVNGLAMAGGATAAIGAYELVHAVAVKLRQDALKKQMAAAQQQYVGTVQDEAAQLNKNAATAPGKPFTGSDIGAGLLPAAAIALALSTGVLTSKYLEKSFPQTRPNVRVNPRRVVLRQHGKPETEFVQQPGKDEHLAEEELQNEALSKDASDNAAELLLRLAVPMDKEASIGLADLAYATAGGRLGEFMNNLGLGVDTAFALIKGASTAEVHPLDLDLAISLLVKDAGACEVALPLAALVFQSKAPVYAAAAANLDETTKLELEKYASEVEVAYRASVYGSELEGAELSKEASGPTPGQLARILGKLLDSANAVE